MLNLITICSIAAYLLSFAALLKQLSQRQPSSKVFLFSFAFAVLAHAWSLEHSIYASNVLNLSLANAASLVFCAIGLISALALMRKMPIENLMLVFLPLSAFAVLAAWLSPGSNSKIISGEGLILHISLSIISYSFISLAALQACMLAIQENQLRAHNFNGLFQYLPPLQTMEKLLFELIWLGFITLSISIGSGFMFLHDMFAQHLAHKTILSIAAWWVFAILLFGRQAWGWRGNTAAKWTLSGFSALMLAYFGSKFVLEVILA
ncbi:MAG: cytochrome c biogenesis protein CcsA [Pseudomonadales bacterium]|nr:cytochrome c biogenesis protein CcsA [Pseudomonadales bacterium]